MQPAIIFSENLIAPEFC